MRDYQNTAGTAWLDRPTVRADGKSKRTLFGSGQLQERVILEDFYKCEVLRFLNLE